MLASSSVAGGETYLGVRAPLLSPTLGHAVARPSSTPVFECQRPSFEYFCYGPHQVRTAYNFPRLASPKNGAGKTIVIIDWQQDPTIEHDLQTFDSTFKLPAPPSFEIIAPFGLAPWEPATEPEDVNSAIEISIDVEWAHALAPAAKIVLLLGQSNSNAEIVATERYVVDHNLGDVVSMSFGEVEECEGQTLLEEEHQVFKEGVEHGMTFFSGTGDEGVAPLNCAYTEPVTHPVNFVPATDPNVTAVGGTSLTADLRSGRYVSESVWNNSPGGGAGGGGYSEVYAAPSFQQGIASIGAQRAVPDVAGLANPNTGALIVCSSCGEGEFEGEFFDYGGTSMATPHWAALAAIADQVAGRRLGNINPALYQIAESGRYARTLHDITEGNNTYAGVSGYSAAQGWDPASGWGSPVANNLIRELARSHAPSGDQTAGVRAARTRRSPPAGAQQKFRALAPG